MTQRNNTVYLLGKAVDGIQILIIVVILLIVGASVATLVLFDVLAGYFFSLMKSGDPTVSLLITFATTGLTISLMFMSKKALEMFTKRGNKVLLIGFVFMGIFTVLGIIADVIFDGLAADILAYGKPTDLSTLPEMDAKIQNIYRFMIGALSFCGEFVALMVLSNFGTIKSILSDAIASVGSRNQNQNRNNNSQRPRSSRGTQQRNPQHSYRPQYVRPPAQQSPRGNSMRPQPQQSRRTAPIHDDDLIEYLNGLG